ncbi:MAG: hypothetical protein AAFR36_27685 [Bacteroidota bacterium]
MTTLLTSIGDKIRTRIIDKIQVIPPSGTRPVTRKRMPQVTTAVDDNNEGQLEVCKVTDKLITVTEEGSGAILWKDKEQVTSSNIPPPPSEEAILSIGKIGNIKITVEKYLKYRRGFYLGHSIVNISKRHQQVSKGNSKTVVAAYSKAYTLLEH